MLFFWGTRTFEQVIKMHDFNPLILERKQHFTYAMDASIVTPFQMNKEKEEYKVCILMLVAIALLSHVINRRYVF